MRRGIFAVVPCALLGIACNSILDNSSATLVSDDTGAEGGTPVDMTDAMSSPPPAMMDASKQPPEMDASTPTMDAGNSGCAAGEKPCDGLCVKTTDPLYGCGGTSCSACLATRGTSTCAAGKCAVGTCDPGYADCNKNPSDGCETDLSSATSCGTCNGVCGVAAPNCAPVGPSFQCTTGCGADAPLLCGKQCTDPMTSAAHCGSCNVACPPVAHGTAKCTGGACGFDCDAQFHACPTNTCARDTDPQACGPTCMACPKPPNAVAICRAMACAFTCTAGTADCDMQAANGCESTLATDPNNCGACGVVCPGTCTKGKCDPVDAGNGGGSDASSSDASSSDSGM